MGNKDEGEEGKRKRMMKEKRNNNHNGSKNNSTQCARPVSNCPRPFVSMVNSLYCICCSCCSNELSQRWWLKTAKIYFLVVPEVGSLKCDCGAAFLRKTLGKCPFPCLSSF